MMRKPPKLPQIIRKSAKVLPLVGSDAWNKREAEKRKAAKQQRNRRKELRSKYAPKPTRDFKADEGPPAKKDEKAAVNNYWSYLCAHYGKRLMPRRFSYWLDGAPVRFETLMVLMNRDRKANGMEQIGIDRNPAWKA